jgi:pentatricopeptide repeat protein
MLKSVILARRQHHHFVLFKRCDPSVQRPPAMPFRRTAALNASRRPDQAYSSRASQTSTRPLDHNAFFQRKVSKIDLSLKIVALIEDVLAKYAVHREIPKSIQAILSNPSMSEFLLEKDSVRKLAEKFACSRTPQRSLDLLRLAHHFGCPIKQNAYECATFQLALSKQWRLVLALVAQGKQHTGRTTSRLLNWRARALTEVQLFNLLHTVLEDFRRHHLTPTRRTFHLILSGHIRNHDLARAKDCLHAMDNAGFPPDASTHATIANYYRSFGTNPQIEEGALANLSFLHPVVAVSVANNLIRTHLDSQDLYNTHRILSLFHRADIETIFGVVFGGDGTFGVVKRLPPPPSFGPLKPNAATFEIFLNHRARHSDLSGALQLLDAMISQDIAPTPRTMASLINVYFAAKQGPAAVQLVAAVCNTQHMWSSLFKPLMSQTSPSTLQNHFAGILPNVHVFNSLLKGLLSAHGLGCVRHILRIMKVMNVAPNEKTVETLLAHLTRVENARPRDLLRVLRKLLSPSIVPTLRHLHIILSCILRHEKYLLYGAGWNVFARKYSSTKRQPTGKQAWLSTTTSSMDPLAGVDLVPHLGRQNLARPILASLANRDVRSDGPALALRIRHDAVIQSDMDSARNVFSDLLARGIHPNEYHFSALMEGYARSGDLEAAVDVLDSAKQSGIKPNVVMFTILIVGHARQGNPRLSLQVFKDMIASEIPPDVPSIDAVASAFYAVGAGSMARRVLIALWPYIQSFPESLRDLPLKELASHFRSLHSNPPNTRSTVPKEQRLQIYRELIDVTKIWFIDRRRSFNRKRCRTLQRPARARTQA